MTLAAHLSRQGDLRTQTAYKAFNADWTCRGYQYEVGKTYKHDGDVAMCESGFHACLNPLEVLDYYDLCDARFAEVEVVEPLTENDDNTKVASAEIHIKAELTLPDFIRRTTPNWQPRADSAQLAASGENSVIASSSYNTQAKGAKGTWISLAEFNGDDECIGFATGCVGKKGVPADTWLIAKGGKLVPKDEA